MNETPSIVSLIWRAFPSVALALFFVVRMVYRAFGRTR